MVQKVNRLLKVVFAIIAFALSVISCNLFSIPNVIYGNWQHISNGYCDNRYILYKDGTYELYTKNDLSALNPVPSQKGTYSVKYSHYKIEEAAGVIYFTQSADDETNEPLDFSNRKYSWKFVWRATQEEGPIELKLYDENYSYTYLWARVYK